MQPNTERALGALGLFVEREPLQWVYAARRSCLLPAV